MRRARARFLSPAVRARRDIKATTIAVSVMECMQKKPGFDRVFVEMDPNEKKALRRELTSVVHEVMSR